MKILLSIVVSIMLSSLINSGYAMRSAFNSLDDLPDELKLYICLQLSCHHQLNLGMVNKSFNAIMADDAIPIRQTASKFGLNFDQVSNSGKKILKDTSENNFVIKELNFHSSNESNFIFCPDELDCMMIGNNGDTDFYRYHDFNSAEEKALIKLLPEDVRDNCRTIINYNGNTLVGNTREINNEAFVLRENSEFISLNYLHNRKFPAYPLAVSDTGEIIVGSSMHDDKESATVWFYGFRDDKSLYHSCLLKDLVMYSCSKAQQEIFQYIDFEEISKLSPNGKAMVFTAKWKSKTPPDLKQLYYSVYETMYFKIVFGTNIESEVPDIAVLN